MCSAKLKANSLEISYGIVFFVLEISICSKYHAQRNGLHLKANSQSKENNAWLFFFFLKDKQ